MCIFNLILFVGLYGIYITLPYLVNTALLFKSNDICVLYQNEGFPWFFGYSFSAKIGQIIGSVNVTQIVDATEGAWMMDRNSNPNPAAAGTINQTYSPYSTNTNPSSLLIGII